MLGHLTHSGDVETTRLDDGIEWVRDAARKYLGQMKCIALPAFDRELHDPKRIAPLHTAPVKGEAHQVDPGTHRVRRKVYKYFRTLSGRKEKRIDALRALDECAIRSDDVKSSTVT